MLSLSYLSIHFDTLALATSYLEIAGLCIYSVKIYWEPTGWKAQGSIKQAQSWPSPNWKTSREISKVKQTRKHKHYPVGDYITQKHGVMRLTWLWGREGLWEGDVKVRAEGWLDSGKKAEHWRIDALELWCWRRLLRVPWTAWRSNQSILKEINPVYALGGLILKLKLQNWPPDAKSWVTGKDPDAGKDWGQEEKGTTEDEIVG